MPITAVNNTENNFTNVLPGWEFRATNLNNERGNL